MLKLLALPLVSLVFITILMTSPLIPLLEKDYSTAMILGSSEEEHNNHDNGGPQLFDSKYYLLKNFLSLGLFPKSDHQQNLLDYAFTVLEYTIEILDPPPKQLNSNLL